MIAINQVTRNFGTRQALGGITLEVLPGEVVALVGPNGAGKSTTLRVLTGALRPDSGTASIAGHDVTQDGARARLGLGYLPQKLGLPEDTVVRDLLVLVATLRGIASADAVAAINAMRLGHRLDARLGELSGGERQRVMLALATAGQIRALVLDEPSISLDSEGAEDVRDAIRHAARAGAAVLFASHHLSDVAALAGRIVLMVDGKVAAQGTLRELALLAGVPAEKTSRELPAIERIYHSLVILARQGDSRPPDDTALEGAA